MTKTRKQLIEEIEKEFEKQFIPIEEMKSNEDKWAIDVEAFIAVKDFLHQSLIKLSEAQQEAMRMEGVASKELDNSDTYKGSSAKREIGFGFNSALQAISDKWKEWSKLKTNYEERKLGKKI